MSSVLHCVIGQEVRRKRGGAGKQKGRLKLGEPLHGLSLCKPSSFSRVIIILNVLASTQYQINLLTIVTA